jgi:hypothetical protein
MKLSANHARAPRIRTYGWGLALLLLAFTASQCYAATYCITAGDVVGLQTALADAANNSEDDVIELQSGYYPMPSNFLLWYEAVSEFHDLTIEGGYGDNLGNPCGSPPAAPDPRLTVLDGGLFRVHLAGGAGSFTLKSVTVQNTFSTDPADPPVEIGGYPNSTGNVTIQNSMFIGNGSTAKAAVYLFTSQGALSIYNSVFATNVSFSSESPVRLGSQRTNGSICALIVNSTFTGNAAAVPAVDLQTPMCSLIAASDIFWGNSASADVYIAYPDSTYTLNDDFGDVADAANTHAANLLSVDPLFNPDYSLRDLSPLRDKGNSGGPIFSPGTFDVVGNARTAGPSPDIGAFEIQDVIFAHGFDFQPPF